MDKDEMFEKEAMYVSPITVAIHEIQRNYNSKVDTLILEEIHKYDVKVDKDELIKALKYDRNQYEKGYVDGKKETAREIFYKLKETLIINNEENTEWFDYDFTLETINELANKYGIELGEEK